MDLVASANERMKGTMPGTLGIEFTEITPDRVCATLRVREEICTVGSILHGGAIMAFADTLGATATAGPSARRGRRARDSPPCSIIWKILGD